MIRVKNTGAPTITRAGQSLAQNVFYTLETVDVGRWQVDTEIAADIASGLLVINDGTTDLGAAAGAAWLAANNATHLGGIEVDASGIGDQKKLIYDSASNKLKYNSDSPGSAAGAKGHVQFRGNQAGSFTASADLTYDDVAVALMVGAPAQSMAGLAVQMTRSRNSYAQHVIQNGNSGTQASADIVACADNGTDSAHYIDLGVNSSTYSDPAYGITEADDGYLYMQDGKLVIGTATALKDLVFHTGGTAAANECVRLVDATNAKNRYVKLSAPLQIDNDTTANRPTTPLNGMLYYNTTTAKLEVYENGAWVNVVGGGGGSGGYYQNITLSDQSNAELTTTLGSYTVVSRCVFPGSSVVTLNKVFASVSVFGSNASMDIRIYDLTNSQVICEKLAISNTTPTAHDLGTLANIPASVAIFEVQMRANGGAGKTAKCSSVLMRS